MRRWNGWGDDSVYMPLPPAGIKLLRERIGEGRIQPDCPLEKILSRIPKTRLPRHPLIAFDAKLRLNHAHGQSLPDWIKLRGGTIKSFPDGVALPSSPEDVRSLMQFAAGHQAIIIPYGGGTSVVGHLDVPETDKPVLSISLRRLGRMITLAPKNRLAAFEAGVRGPQLEQQLRTQGFTLGHYPQSFEYSTLGGWVATRSSGQQSNHYGRIEQLFAGGEVLTPRGLIKLPPMPASAAGPDVRQLVLGSEGRLGLLTKAIVRISRIPEKDDIYGMFFPSWHDGQRAIQALAGSGLSYSMIRLSNPAETTINLALSGRDRQVGLLLRYLRLRGILPGKACMCLIGFTGSRRSVRTNRRETFAIVRRLKGVTVGRAIGRAWKMNRFRSAYLRNTLWDKGYAVDTLETAVTWENVTTTMAAIEESLTNCLASKNERVHAFSHLSHIYTSGSSIYTTFVFRLAKTPQETLTQWQTLKSSASHAVVASGGTISHQHGIGTDHRPYITAEKGALAISTLQKVFAHLDPDQIMNPTKLLPDDVKCTEDNSLKS